jgi:hypothetical protein
MHDAAEYIAKAQEQGATQRVIAERVGKSVGWVNRLLQWRLEGYKETAFGPPSKARRERVQATEQQKPKSRTAEQEEAARAKAQAQKAKADAAKAKADAAKAKADARRAREEAKRAEHEAHASMFADFRPKREVHSSDRTLLVKFLGSSALIAMAKC